MSITLEDRIRGGIYGLLIGDALGVPYEFHSPESLPPQNLIELEPPGDFRRAHQSARRGAWSDDGAQALCLLASLLQRGKLDLDDLGRRFVNWYEYGYMAVDNHVFDVGVQTAKAITLIRNGCPAEKAGSTEEQALGNGALMRVLPLALWHTGSDDDLISLAHKQSLLTHGHLRSQICCALYCLWARELMRGGDWSSAVATLRYRYANNDAALAELEMHIRPEEDGKVTGGGYVVDCLRSAAYVMRHSTYEDVVRSAVALGNDTDTTACVAGGVAGVRDGVAAIPERWMMGLAEKETVEPLVQALVEHRRHG